MRSTSIQQASHDECTSTGIKHPSHHVRVLHDPSCTGGDWLSSWGACVIYLYGSVISQQEWGWGKGNVEGGSETGESVMRRYQGGGASGV